MRSKSPRFSNFSRTSLICWFDQGHANKHSKVMATNQGQAKTRAGRTKERVLWPLLCQITISLSAYMRDKVDTMAMYRLRVSSECMLLSMV